MHIINITVQDKIATHVGDAYYVCGNSDFVVRFDFDEEWAALDVKTARFIREDGAYHDQVFSGNECPVPIISNTNNVRVGVFAGNLCTTTPARVPAAKSILCPGGVPAAPGDDVYNQIMQEVNETRGAANETAQALQEACGEGGLYLVTCVVHASDKEWHANRTQEEIRAAVAAKKTCLLSIRGKVYTYLDEQNNNSGESCPTFVRPGYYVSGQGIALETLKVEANGKIHTSYPGVSRTPNPRSLTIKQGDKSATYDGSSAVTVEIPQGGGGESAPKIITILAETALTVADADAGMYALLTPFNHKPAGGMLCTVTYNGVEYECKSAEIEGNGGNIVALGNLALMGVEGGNTEAPFALACIPDGSDGMYAMLMATDAPAGVTVSVTAVEIDEAVVAYVDAKADAAESKLMAALHEMDTELLTVTANLYNLEVTNVSHTYAEIVEAIKAGKAVQMKVINENAYSYVAPLVVWRDDDSQKIVKFQRSYFGASSTENVVLTITILGNGTTTAEFMELPYLTRAQVEELINAKLGGN